VPLNESEAERENVTLSAAKNEEGQHRVQNLLFDWVIAENVKQPEAAPKGDTFMTIFRGKKKKREMGHVLPGRQTREA